MWALLVMFFKVLDDHGLVSVVIRTFHLSILAVCQVVVDVPPSSSELTALLEYVLALVRAFYDFKRA